MISLFRKSREINAWLDKDRSTIRVVDGYKHWLNQQTELRTAERRGEAESKYLELIDAAMQPEADGALPVFVVDSDASEPMYERVIAKLLQADRLGLVLPQNIRNLDLTDRWLSRFEVRGGESVRLDRCRVAKLVLGPDTLKSARIVNCTIGEFVFAGRTHGLDLRNTHIRQVSIPNNNIPVLEGPATIRRVSFPTNRTSLQPLRQLRAELVRIHSIDAAGPVHAAEQRISRKDLDGTDWFFSLMYDLTSAYGSKTSRPLGWFFAFAGASVALLAISGGTALTDRMLAGWQYALSGSTPTASAGRAAYLSLNQIFNPLGVFGANPLVVSTEPWIAAASMLICFLATVSLGLFVLALRRRFRLDGR